MLVDVVDVCTALDELALGREQAFQRLLPGARLRCEGSGGAPDYVDDLNTRLVVTTLRADNPTPLLMVLPDESVRRPALAFAATLVLDGLSRIRARARYGTVLYATSSPGVRAQLLSVRLGGLGLGSVFTQHYTKGDASDVRTLSATGGLHLPRVFVVCAPADPAAILRAQKPVWVAVDCGDGRRTDWLEELVPAARAIGVPVVGWTSSPFGSALDAWRSLGGAIFSWPRLKTLPTGALNGSDVQRRVLVAEVSPSVIVGDDALRLSQLFATAVEALVAARSACKGRLSSDSMSLAWRLLRTLEGLPVRLEDYEREAPHHWGTPQVEALSATLTRFLNALQSTPSPCVSEIQAAVNALAGANEILANGHTPMWHALSNLCVDAKTPQTLVFSSRSRKEIFRQCLLSRFNIGEDDLHAVGTRLAHLSESHDGAEFSEDHRFVLIGFPSGERARFLPRYLDCGTVHVVVWPHQQNILHNQVGHLAARMNMSTHGLEFLSPVLVQALNKPARSSIPTLRLTEHHDLVAGELADELRVRHESASLWRRPDLGKAIAALFQGGSHDEDDLSDQVLTLSDSDDDTALPSDTLWVDSVVELTFEGKRRLVLAVDETVNVIVHHNGRPRLEERYARGVRPRDEILLIRGQQRQTLYALLISRVHLNPLIAQYLQLVQRWQDDFARAYSQSELTEGLTEESFLEKLRAMGSDLTSAQTIRTWVRRSVLAPNDMDDLRRVAKILPLPFVETYYRQIHLAGRRLKGLHINLSTRLNRWLISGEAAAATESSEDDVVDAELGLTIDDFRHSLLRLTVSTVRTQPGRYYRGSLGRLEEEP